MSITSNKGAQPGQVAKADLVTLTIDGIEVSVAKGTLVIRAAEQVGVSIPRFCDHPLLAPVGACRQCLVEVALPGPDGEPRTMMGPPGRVKPQASCTLVASDGMVVNTQLSSPIADKAQQGVMEQLLINHPLDCPVCDKGGECPLQNQAMSNGRGESRYEGVKRTYPKPIHISAQVLLDRERCVLCARCTRFSEQIAGDPFIALIERGALQQVGIYEKEPFESYFSGNTIQICPVGALTSAAYRFRARPFDLISTPSVAEHDACGSAIRVDHRRGKVVRRLAGDDPEVNEEWITDKDRFAFGYARAEDRLTHPLVRDPETGAHRAASWPEAFAIAARGLQAAADEGGVGVLTGGRLTLEDAYAYAKFARTALGTNDVDFRARPGSAEETDFLASTVAGSGIDVTFSDLERVGTVVLVGLEPEDEAGTLFLRLRKASRQGLRVYSVAPFATRGLRKMDGTLLRTAPGQETAVIEALAHDGEVALDGGGVILVGERLATVPGALSAVVALAGTTGARLAWVPRRAGDRGAVEAGCLPTVLPGGRPVADAAARVDVGTVWGTSMPHAPGRHAEAIVAAAAAGELAGLVVAGVDPDDTADPRLTRAALDTARFVVSLELRATDVTRAADVVFPVAPVVEKAGSFVNWEGRVRPFEKVLEESHALPDLRVLAGIADELGRPLGFKTVEAARAELADIGPWDGARVPAPTGPTAEPTTGSSADEGSYTLATWKQMVDDGSLQDGDENYKATGRAAVLLVSPSTLAGLGVAAGANVTVHGPHGTVTLPVAVADLPDDVVWAPANNDGVNLTRDLGLRAGSAVRVAGGALSPSQGGAA
ncbi:NADH-quinone oxidoreductase subunit G [Nocardioides mesophilus]|uniref:NADH-quinone oxidoreductase n=1 Tax=Nocardioides mesophilus TaxID=433659 RepID=A0A7G9R6Q8_9ACTN|nr:NADH-quinone oxidoreductase subunit G [Nocardioides mesophilus]QNN51283.1 NADH-quinone oxidoreductase subunit G [Nocardioides mesophilus]